MPISLRLFLTALLISLIFVGGALAGASSVWPTHPAGVCPEVQNSPSFTIVYGLVTALNAAAPAGTVVEARTIGGVTAGCFVVTTAGSYGAFYIYGEDLTVNPTVPGMKNGEIVQFYIDGLAAVPSTSLTWQNDQAFHQINLNLAQNLPPTSTATATGTATKTATATMTPTATPTSTATATATSTATATQPVGGNTATPTATATATPTATSTPSEIGPSGGIVTGKVGRLDISASFPAGAFAENITVEIIPASGYPVPQTNLGFLEQPFEIRARTQAGTQIFQSTLSYTLRVEYTAVQPLGYTQDSLQMLSYWDLLGSEWRTVSGVIHLQSEAVLQVLTRQMIIYSIQGSPSGYKLFAPAMAR